MTDIRPAKRKPGRPKADVPSNVMPALLRTASVLFMEYGYDSVSLGQIAAACGVTKASVYYYFPNKAELFVSAVTTMLAGIGKRTSELLDRPGPLRERLTDVADAYMRHAHVDFESLLREAGSSLSPEQLGTIREAERSVHDVLAAAFRKEMEAGAIRPGDPFLYAYAFSSLMMLGSRTPDASRGRDGKTDALAGVTASDIVGLFWNGVGLMV
ncbi:TetR/AcrR family transcriptional regulator [Paenibacillus flagellatus]|uniref:TetR/AcrR family transcriptional regulator n=1 Tax=Paenibacillus flagellatus TaxID=2211139 RepID=A0A2V5KBP9_9BACL|nr:TetR/AcrR family transcriptional regulator [Paenibacillus flagellatus]PYI56402.1 TetR/AcrR family transcriptional regulator [Paenibacillus flagellatus]